MSKDEPVEKILTPFGESKNARRERLFRVLIVRICGIVCLYVCYQAISITLTQGNISKLVAMFLGAVVLVMGFIGIVLTFGKIESTKKSKVDADAVADAWSQGYDAGYDDCYIDYFGSLDEDEDQEDDQVVAGSESGANSQPQ